jgi:hypothetical protein
MSEIDPGSGHESKDCYRDYDKIDFKDKLAINNFLNDKVTHPQYEKIKNWYYTKNPPIETNKQTTGQNSNFPQPPHIQTTEQPSILSPPQPELDNTNDVTVQTEQEIPQETVPLNCNGSNNREEIYEVKWDNNKASFFKKLEIAIKTAKQTGKCSKIVITGINYNYNDEASNYVDSMKKIYNYQNQVFITTQTQTQGGKRKTQKKQRKQRKNRKKTKKV